MNEYMHKSYTLDSESYTVYPAVNIIIDIKNILLIILYTMCDNRNFRWFEINLGLFAVYKNKIKSLYWHDEELQHKSLLYTTADNDDNMYEGKSRKQQDFSLKEST